MEKTLKSLNDKFQKALKEKAIPTVSHAVYSLPRALGQDVAATYGIIDKDKGMETYKRNNDIHNEGETSDYMDDGSAAHDIAKLAADNFYTYPLSLALATGLNLATVGHPNVNKVLQVAGDAGINVGTDFAKSRVMGKKYGEDELKETLLAGLGTEVATGWKKLPSVHKYVALGTAPQILGRVGKAKAEELEKDIVDAYMNMQQNEEYRKLLAEIIDQEEALE